jgi:hypothetical protein
MHINGNGHIACTLYVAVLLADASSFRQMGVPTHASIIGSTDLHSEHSRLYCGASDEIACATMQVDVAAGRRSELVLHSTPRIDVIMRLD